MAFLLLHNYTDFIYVNEATINTANYFIISNKEFTRYQYKYIDNRFNNKNWEIGYPHVNLKN